MFIHHNLNQLHRHILEFEEKYHRVPHSVFLLAISKGQDLEKIQQAIAAGQLAFGENYLQEALKKIAEINHPQIEWHFTGHIQSNKTQEIARHFSWAHTVTNQKIAQRLNDQRPAILAPLNICLEVNVSREASKSGVMALEELVSLARFCISLPRLKLRGLMTIPQPQEKFEAQRAELHQLVLMKEELCQRGFELDTLSMGMTDDLEAAIAEGATMVRVGRGIFGGR